MKEYLEFHLLKRWSEIRPLNNWLAPHVFENAAKRFPEFVISNRSSLSFKLLKLDPKVAEIFDYLKREVRVQPILSNTQDAQIRVNDGSYFTVQTRYEFSEEDLQEAAFFHMSALVEFKRDRKSGLAAWRWELEKPPKKPLPLIGYMEDEEGEICTAGARAELEHEGFPGLDFLPIILHDPRYPDGVFWRIWASRIMPKVTMPLCAMEGTPVKDDYSTGCAPDEIIANQLILKYKATDLTAMNGTDFALTAEKWGSPKDRGRRERLVVSQRMRQWCLKRNVQMNWTPVIALPE